MMSPFQRIRCLFRLLHRMPNITKGTFEFDGPTKLIVGKRLINYLDDPLYDRFWRLEQFFVHIDIVLKRVMYYGWDTVENDPKVKVNEQQGDLDWSDIEGPLLSYLVQLNRKRK